MTVHGSGVAKTEICKDTTGGSIAILLFTVYWTSVI